MALIHQHVVFPCLGKQLHDGVGNFREQEVPVCHIFIIQHHFIFRIVVHEEVAARVYLQFLYPRVPIQRVAQLAGISHQLFIVVAREVDHEIAGLFLHTIAEPQVTGSVDAPADEERIAHDAVARLQHQSLVHRLTGELNANLSPAR